MRLTVFYEGQALGAAEFGPPNEQGLQQGILRPSPAYHAVRHHFAGPLVELAEMRDARGEDIRATLLSAQAQLAEHGLMVRDAAGDPVLTAFLMVGDALPPGADPEILDHAGVPITIKCAPAT